MKTKNLKIVVAAILAAIIVALGIAVASRFFAVNASADANDTEIEATVEEEEQTEDEENATGTKAIAAAVVVGIAAFAGALSMGIAIAKSVEGIARQPEAEGKIRTTLMMGLVFIETAIIYALVIAILVIFVL